MADLLPPNPMKYELIRNNRFIVRFPSDLGIQVWEVTKASLPKLTVNSVAIEFMNTETYVPGRYKWEPIQVTFRNFIGPSSAQALMEWIRLDVESLTGRQGYSAGLKRDITIEMLDPTGVTVQKWLLKNAFPTSYSQSDADYSQDGVNEITTDIQYDYAILVF